MEYIGKIEKIEHFHNVDNLSPEEILKLKGCNLVFNSVFFNGDLTPCDDLKIDGKILKDSQYSYFGFAWNKDDTELKIVASTEGLRDYDNFATCVPLVIDRHKVDMYVDKALQNVPRGQVVLATLNNGKFVLYGTDDNNPVSRVNLRQYFFAEEFDETAHVVHAISWDGGRSVGVETPDWSIKPLNEHGSNKPRNVPFYLCIWTEDEGGPIMDTSKKIKGIDVSEHQGVINWDKVKATGIEFAYIRAGYGRNNIDKQFIRNISECNRLGIPVGIYWFSYAYTEEMAKNEAKYCLEAIKPYRVELPVCFDFEYESISYAKGKGVTVTNTMGTAFVNAFCGEIEKANYFAMFYGNKNLIAQCFDSALLKRYAYWLATYPKAPNLDNPPETCGVWQYSSTASIDGITGNVDVNVAYIDYAALIKSYGMNNLKGDTTDVEDTQTSTETEEQKPATEEKSDVERAIEKLRANGYDSVLIAMANLVK